MTEHWQIVVTLVSIMVAVGGLCLWAVSFIVRRVVTGHSDQYKTQLEAAAKQCESAAKQCAELAARVASYQAIERQVMDLRAILPIDYVRKEDFIRHEVVINTKLDRIFDRMQGGSRGTND